MTSYEHICPASELHLPQNRLFSLAIELQTIFPSYSHVGFEEEEFYLYLDDGSKRALSSWDVASLASAKAENILVEMSKIISQVRAQKVEP